MRKIKATLGLLALTGILATSSLTGMNYGAVLSASGNPNSTGAGFALAVGGAIACSPFTPIASIACGVAGAL